MFPHCLLAFLLLEDSVDQVCACTHVHKYACVYVYNNNLKRRGHRFKRELVKKKERKEVEMI